MGWQSSTRALAIARPTVLRSIHPRRRKDDLELWRQVMADCNLSNQSKQSPSGQNDSYQCALEDSVCYVHKKTLYVAPLHDVDFTEQ